MNQIEKKRQYFSINVCYQRIMISIQLECIYLDPGY